MRKKLKRVKKTEERHIVNSRRICTRAREMEFNADDHDRDRADRF